MPQKQKPRWVCGAYFFCKTVRPAGVITKVQTLLLAKPVKIFATDIG